MGAVFMVFASASVLASDDARMDQVLRFTDGDVVVKPGDDVPLNIVSGVSVYVVPSSSGERYLLRSVKHDGASIEFLENDDGYRLSLPPTVGEIYDLTLGFDVDVCTSGVCRKSSPVTIGTSFKSTGQANYIGKKEVLVGMDSEYRVNFGMIGDGSGLRGRRVVELFNLNESIGYSVDGVQFSLPGSRLITHDFSESMGVLSLPVSTLRAFHEGEAALSVRVSDTEKHNVRLAKDVNSRVYARYGGAFDGFDWSDQVGNRALSIKGLPIELDAELGREVLSFGGSGYVDLMALQDIFALGGGFTYSMLVKFPVGVSGPMSLLALGDNEGIENLDLMVGGTTRNRIEVNFQGEQRKSASPSILGGGWHRLTVVRDGKAVSVYVGEMLIGQWDVRGAEISGSFNFIGRAHSGVRAKYMSGYLAEFSVWREPLTSEEVRAMSIAGW